MKISTGRKSSVSTAFSIFTPTSLLPTVIRVRAMYCFPCTRKRIENMHATMKLLQKDKTAALPYPFYYYPVLVSGAGRHRGGRLPRLRPLHEFHRSGLEFVLRYIEGSQLRHRLPEPLVDFSRDAGRPLGPVWLSAFSYCPAAAQQRTGERQPPLGTAPRPGASSFRALRSGSAIFPPPGSAPTVSSA